MSTPPHILYQSPSATVTLIDIPRSIEEAQGGTSRKLISTKPLDKPFPSLEPKSEKARRNLGEPSLEDLLIQKHLELALEEIRHGYAGEWCLPRMIVNGPEDLGDEHLSVGGKKRKSTAETTTTITANVPEVTGRGQNIPSFQEVHVSSTSNFISHHNPSSSPTTIATSDTPSSSLAHNHHFHIPPRATVLQADVPASRRTLLLSAPQFDLILLDAPWPNRSARRKQSYSLSSDTQSIEELLLAIPIETKLASAGLVGVWVTNKPLFREMLLREGGLFDRWGVVLVEEWVWVKVTSGGEPVLGLGEAWRKPWEVLLVGRRREMGGSGDGGHLGVGVGMETGGAVQRRVIAGVPDLHSRKPNLKSLFESLMGKGGGEYEALEVFARNLSEGWWSWGNEALKFQSEEHWMSKGAESDEV